MPIKQVSPARNYLIILGLVLLLFFLDHFHFVDFHELDAVDLRILLRGREPGDPALVIVEIDDNSIRAIGQWPWPRSVHAVLLEVLSQYEPRVVFYDVLFTEFGPNPAEDESLGLAAEKGRVIMPFYYISDKPFTAFFPVKPLKDSAWALGYVNIHPDRDGRVRRIRTSIEAPEDTYYHTSVLAALSQFMDQEKSDAWLGSIPRDSHNDFWINYPGPVESFKRISFNEVIATAGTERSVKMRELFHDRVVLVGHTGTGSTDLLSTPFPGMTPGVAVQASAMHTLLTGKFLRPLNLVGRLFTLVILALFAAWMTKTYGPKKALIFVPCMIFLYAAWNVAVFSFVGWIFPLFLPMISMAGSYVMMLFLEYTEIRFQGELIGRELSTAARIQETFLPQKEPKIAGLDVAYECRFARQVGGDLYDWVDLGGGRFGICVGDVSGKGVPAAIYMARAISDFRRENQDGRQAKDACDSLNNLLAREGTAGMFVTLFYAIVDNGQKKISFANAGHEPMIYYRYRTKKAEVLEGSRGKPIGLFSEERYEQAEIRFEEGDLFVLLTDGVKELRNPKNQEFGIERVRSLVEEYAADLVSAKQIVERLFTAMRSFRRGTLPHDDRTLACVKFGSRF